MVSRPYGSPPSLSTLFFFQEMEMVNEVLDTLPEDLKDPFLAITCAIQSLVKKVSDPCPKEICSELETVSDPKHLCAIDIWGKDHFTPYSQDGRDITEYDMSASENRNNAIKSIIKLIEEKKVFT